MPAPSITENPFREKQQVCLLQMIHMLGLLCEEGGVSPGLSSKLHLQVATWRGPAHRADEGSMWVSHVELIIKGMGAVELFGVELSDRREGEEDEVPYYVPKTFLVIDKPSL
jgi:hypothetical protein